MRIKRAPLSGKGLASSGALEDIVGEQTLAKGDDKGDVSNSRAKGGNDNNGSSKSGGGLPPGGGIGSNIQKDDGNNDWVPKEKTQTTPLTAKSPIKQIWNDGTNTNNNNNNNNNNKPGDNTIGRTKSPMKKSTTSASPSGDQDQNQFGPALTNALPDPDSQFNKGSKFLNEKNGSSNNNNDGLSTLAVAFIIGGVIFIIIIALIIGVDVYRRKRRKRQRERVGKMKDHNANFSRSHRSRWLSDGEDDDENHGNQQKDMNFPSNTALHQNEHAVRYTPTPIQTANQIESPSILSQAGSVTIPFEPSIPVHLNSFDYNQSNNKISPTPEQNNVYNTITKVDNPTTNFNNNNNTPEHRNSAIDNVYTGLNMTSPQKKNSSVPPPKSDGFSDTTQQQQHGDVVGDEIYVDVDGDGSGDGIGIGIGSRVMAGGEGKSFVGSVCNNGSGEDGEREGGGKEDFMVYDNGREPYCSIIENKGDDDEVDGNNDDDDDGWNYFVLEKADIENNTDDEDVVITAGESCGNGKNMVATTTMMADSGTNMDINDNNSRENSLEYNATDAKEFSKLTKENDGGKKNETEESYKMDGNGEEENDDDDDGDDDEIKRPDYELARNFHNRNSYFLQGDQESHSTI